jgi:hypothetical protein
MFLSNNPFFHARSPIEHFATDARPWRPNRKHRPAVERAGVPPQFSGELFLRQKFQKKRYYLGHGKLLRVVTRTWAPFGEVYEGE